MTPARKLLLAVVVWLLVGPVAAEEFRWLAFGDSITLGNYDNPNQGGYPGRLNNLFNCSPGVCEIFNAGKSGEKTYQGVSRIDDVFEDDGPFDVMILMEGTNDIFREDPVESAVTNLSIMALKARNYGTDTVHGSIIWFHPGGEHGRSKDDEVEYIRDQMENLGIIYQRYFVDIWDVLCPDSHPDVHGHNQNQCFNQHYAPAPPDDRGHPVASGYTMMANAYFQGLTAVPVPGVSDPVAPEGVGSNAQVLFEWDRESPVRANWYQLTVEDTQGTVLDLWLEARVYCSATDCSYQILFPLAEDDHVWRVRGRNPAGYGPWSPDTMFQVLSQSIFVDGFESGNTDAWSPLD